MRILVTGSADGLGRAAADTLLSGLSGGHDVVVHARNPDRAASLAALVDRGADIVVGDFADRDAVRRIAAELNGRDPLDAVIHNAGVWRGRAVMPVNIIALKGAPENRALADAGVGRISYGPVPYRMMVAWFEEQARAVYESV